MVECHGQAARELTSAPHEVVRIARACELLAKPVAQPCEADARACGQAKPPRPHEDGSKPPTQGLPRRRTQGAERAAVKADTRIEWKGQAGSGRRRGGPVEGSVHAFSMSPSLDARTCQFPAAPHVYFFMRSERPCGASPLALLILAPSAYASVALPARCCRCRALGGSVSAYHSFLTRPRALACALVITLWAGCSTSDGSGAGDGTTGFDNSNNPIGGGTNGAGGNGGPGAAINGVTDGDAGQGATNGGLGGGAGGYAGPLENVGDACDTAGDDCINGRCSIDIPGYGAQPGGACTRACASHDECGPDGLCARGLGVSECLRSCSADADCRQADYFCGSLNEDPLGTGTKVCRPKPTGRAKIPNGKVGGRCAADADCGTKASCKTELERRTPAPGGYCTGACFEDTDCGSGGLCVGDVRSSAGVNGQCYLKCKDKSMCPTGDQCRVPFTADGSLLGLATDTVCLPPPPPTTLTGTTAGELCMDDTSCPGGVCETEVVGRRAMSGICTGTCTKNEQCGTGADCYGSNALTGTQGECLRRCTSILELCGTDRACVRAGERISRQPEVLRAPRPVRAGADALAAPSTTRNGAQA